MEEVTYFPTYSILPIQDVHLRSRKVLHKDSPPIIEEQTKQGEKSEKSHLENQIKKGKTNYDSNTTLLREVSRAKNKESNFSLEFDILDELNNSYVKIPLLQAIKKYTNLCKNN